jgi:hypothetical protein
MSRIVMALFALVFVAAAAGCGGPEPRKDDPQLAAIDAGQRAVRDAARRLAPYFSAEADEVMNAAKAGKDEAAGAAKERLGHAETALFALDEAEQTYGIARRLRQVEDDLQLSREDRTRLDATIGRMTEATARLARDAVALVEAVRRQDAPEVARLAADIERVKAALKAYRTDLALTTRLRTPQAIER